MILVRVDECHFNLISFIFINIFFFLLISVDIDPMETTTQLPAISDMAALGNLSKRCDVHRLRLSFITINLPILLIILLKCLRSFTML